MAKKVKPAMYVGFHGWGWVKLTELCELVGVTPTQLFANFNPLSKDADCEVLAIEILGEFRNLEFRNLEKLESDAQEVATQLNREPSENVAEVVDSVFVPAGWTLDVLKAHEEGFTHFSLSCEFIDEDDEVPDNWWNIHHNTGFHNQYHVAIGYKD